MSWKKVRIQKLDLIFCKSINIFGSVGEGGGCVLSDFPQAKGVLFRTLPRSNSLFPIHAVYSQFHLFAGSRNRASFPMIKKENLRGQHLHMLRTR